MSALGTAELYELPRAIPGQLLLFEPPARSSTFDGAPVVVEAEQRSLFAEPERERCTPGHADWGTFTPDERGVCLSCGRVFGWHAGRGCFAPDAAGMPAPDSNAARMDPDTLGLPPVEANPLLTERSTTP